MATGSCLLMEHVVSVASRQRKRDGARVVSPGKPIRDHESAAAAGTLLVLDGSLPGGLIDGSGTLEYGQTMAFTTLTMFQLYNVFNARSDERSAFTGLLANGWLWAAVGLSLMLHVAVVYVPFLQEAFSTVSLSIGDWLLCAAVASSVLWLREISKIVVRNASPGWKTRIV
jgi:P-type Ca2+ transporter type 2C